MCIKIMPCGFSRGGKIVLRFDRALPNQLQRVKLIYPHRKQHIVVFNPNSVFFHRKIHGTVAG